MPKPPKPEDDRNVLRAKERVNYGAFAAVVVVGLSHAAGYDPVQAVGALASIRLATGYLETAATSRASGKSLDTVQNNVLLQERNKALPAFVKRGGGREEVPTDLGKGDRGRARPKRDRGR